jgi:hypothetical protein
MKKTVRFAACICSFAVMLGFAATMQAQQVTNLSIPATYTTLQAAIDAADPGDTIRINVNITEGLIVVNKPLTIFGQGGGGKMITSTSPNFGIQVAASGVVLFRFQLNNAGTYGIITAPGADDLTIQNVTVSDCGLSGFAITCVNNVMLNNITANSNGGNAVSITDCDNVTIDGITTDGENKFSSLAPFSGGIGIFSSGLFCTPGVDDVTITGAVDIQDFVALILSYRLVVSNSI